MLVDDHAPFRKAVAELLAAEHDFELVGEASDGAQALEMARELMPDVVLMDISMPGVDGLEATRRIKAEIPCVRIVILTASECGRSHLEALKRGAHGCLQKAVEPRVLLDTLRRVARGEPSISRGLAALLLEDLAWGSPPTPSPAPLGVEVTRRERESLELVAQGRSIQEASAALGLAENAVSNHLANLLEKLHIGERVQAAGRALRRQPAARPDEVEREVMSR